MRAICAGVGRRSGRRRQSPSPPPPKDNDPLPLHAANGNKTRWAGKRVARAARCKAPPPPPAAAAAAPPRRHPLYSFEVYTAAARAIGRAFKCLVTHSTYESISGRSFCSALRPTAGSCWRMARGVGRVGVFV